MAARACKHDFGPYMVEAMPKRKVRQADFDSPARFKTADRRVMAKVRLIENVDLLRAVLDAIPEAKTVQEIRARLSSRPT